MRHAIVPLLFALTACTVGPDFKPPPDPAIAHWNDASARQGDRVSEVSNPDPEWWASFDDPVLTTLIKQAISGNIDLQRAVLRVVESRQGIISAGAGALPTVSGTGSYMREQLGLRGLLLSQGAFSSAASASGAGAGIGNELNSFTQPVNLYQYGLNASWELDLFGRVRRSVEQAQASTEAQVDAMNDALVMLEGQVAQAYIQLRGAQALTASQEENIRISQQALALTREREQQGIASDLDVQQQLTQLADFEYVLPGYEKQAQQAMNRLSVLTGQVPGATDALLGAAALPTVPDTIGIGVPSTLARRRPDIRQAEAQLHAATANVGVATASFYPDISLTGDFGLRATDASYLTNWASAFYSFGPAISLPIFQGGKLTANLRLARAQQAEAALAYRGTVLNALQEVEDALIAYRTDRAGRDKLQEAVTSGEQSLYLARDAYTHGLADFLRVLDAERTLVGSRQQLVQANVALINDVVGLYNALGGGWQETVARSDAPAIDPAPPIAPAALDAVAAGPEKPPPPQNGR
jgi:NodT family efflux transporter outer membrane factor (OMF) lipoprotein